MGQLVADGLENKYYTYYATGLPHAVYSDAAKTMVLARFTYDERGQRLLKESYSTDGTTLTQRTWYLRDAGGGEQCVLVHDATAALTSEQLTIGGTRGLGVYERIAKRTLYNLTDHLGNVRVVLDHTDEGVTSIAAAHDYYPHGGIMPGRSYTSALLRSLEYQGMERDGETDLVIFELRSMDVRLGRWQAPDPYAQYHSPYLAMGNNPVSRVDPDGGYDVGSREYYDAGMAEWEDTKQWHEDMNEFGDYTEVANRRHRPGGRNADGSARDMDAMAAETMRRFYKRNENHRYREVTIGFGLKQQRIGEVGSTPFLAEFVELTETIDRFEDGLSYWGNTWSNDEKMNVFNYGNFLTNVGSTLVGSSEMALKYIRNHDNGPRDLARGASNLIMKHVGTQRTATWLREGVESLGRAGKRIGAIGAIFSIIDYRVNFDEKNKYDHASFWTGMGVLALTIINPATAVVGVVYGAAQVASYLYNGKSAEENIANSIGF